MTRPEVTVVGGGLAGIAAALTAADAGARVEIFEQRPHLGGAASSFRRGNLHLDHGQHVFLRCCTAYRSLIRRIGGEADLFLQDRLEVPVLEPGSKPAWIRRGVLPPPLHLARAIAGYHPLSLGERLAVAPAARALKRLDPQDGSLDDVTFGSWLKDRGQTDRAIEAFWDLIALPTLNLPSSQASLLAAARTFQMGILTETAAADIGWATVPLSRLHDELARQALAAAGVEVHLRTGVEAVTSESERRPRLILSGRRALEAGTVIVAVPPRSLPALFPSPDHPVARLAADLGRSPIVNVHLRFDRQVMPFSIAAAIGPAPKWVFDRTAAAEIKSGQYLVVSESAADHHVNASEDSIVSTVLGSLREFLPALGKATLLGSLVTKDPAATIRVRPGSARLRAAGHSWFPGVFLAGAWADTGWPPTMESAVRSGAVAAEAALGLNRSEAER